MVKNADGKVMKVGVLPFTKDPEEKIRFLMRHNKPFNGYDDEWTFAFGAVEEGENIIDAAKRECFEEYDLDDFVRVYDLKHTVDYESKHGSATIYFVALEIKDLDVKILLNEESIGYDWMLADDVKRVMKYEDEFKAVSLLLNIIK